MSESNITPVFVNFVGQSNMQGYRMDYSTLAQTEWKPDPLTFIWNPAHNRFDPMKPVLNGDTESWGPELGFAISFRNEYPETPLYIVKTARGGTGLQEGLTDPSWDVGTRNSLFDLNSQRLDMASKFLGQRPDAVFISQGETDAFFEHSAANYYDNFNEWLDAIRSEWMQDANGYVAWTRVADSTPFFETVRWAQYVIDRDTSHTDSFDTSDRNMFARGDGELHFDAAGYVSIGERFFELFEARGNEIIEPSIIPEVIHPQEEPSVVEVSPPFIIDLGDFNFFGGNLF